MRLLIAALAALPLSAAAAEPRGTASLPEPAAEVECSGSIAHKAGPGRAEFKKLNELPPADAFHAVLRLDGSGCLDPVMVGYQYGRRYKAYIPSVKRIAAP